LAGGGGGGVLGLSCLMPKEGIARFPKPVAYVFDIPRRMWSVWMFTIPALRARECTNTEKDALNLLFLLIPVLNVTLPLVWKSFPFIFTTDCAAMGAVYVWKFGLPGQQKAEE
jgi:hypothetical protein